MQEHEGIKDYCRQICEQIRWKSVHPAICEEMANHIMDQREAWVEQGMSEEAATHKAIAMTGDPVDIGTAFDRIHRPKPQFTMIFLVVILLLTGLGVNLYRAVTAGEAAGGGTMAVLSDMGTLNGISDHVIACCIGLTIMLLVYYTDFTWIGRYPLAFYCFILGVTVAAFFFSPKVNGVAVSARYFLLLFPTAYAAFLYSMRRKRFAGILLCGAAWLIPAVIALTIPSLSGMLIFTFSGLVLLCFAIGKGWFLVRKSIGFSLVLFPTLAVSGYFCLVILQNPNSFHLQRLRSILHPEYNPDGMGYMPLLLRSRLANSGWFGPKTPYMPDGTESLLESKDYFINYLLTWLTEHLGWAGLLLVIFLMVLFIGTGLMLWRKLRSVLGQLLALSVILTLFLQTSFYIITNMGLDLFGTLCLPFLSAGKMALCVDLGLTGLMLSTFRNANHPAAVKDLRSSYRGKPSF